MCLLPKQLYTVCSHLQRVRKEECSAIQLAREARGFGLADDAPRRPRPEGILVHRCQLEESIRVVYGWCPDCAWHFSPLDLRSEGAVRRYWAYKNQCRYAFAVHPSLVPREVLTDDGPCFHVPAGLGTLRCEFVSLLDAVTSTLPDAARGLSSNGLVPYLDDVLRATLEWAAAPLPRPPPVLLGREYKSLVPVSELATMTTTTTTTTTTRNYVVEPDHDTANDTTPGSPSDFIYPDGLPNIHRNRTGPMMRGNTAWFAVEPEVQRPISREQAIHLLGTELAGTHGWTVVGDARQVAAFGGGDGGAHTSCELGHAEKVPSPDRVQEPSGPRSPELRGGGAISSPPSGALSKRRRRSSRASAHGRRGKDVSLESNKEDGSPRRRARRSRSSQRRSLSTRRPEEVPLPPSAAAAAAVASPKSAAGDNARHPATPPRSSLRFSTPPLPFRDPAAMARYLANQRNRETIAERRQRRFYARARARLQACAAERSAADNNNKSSSSSNNATKATSRPPPVVSGLYCAALVASPRQMTGSVKAPPVASPLREKAAQAVCWCAEMGYDGCECAQRQGPATWV